jgi:NADH-quinone oxidoreductase subunit C
VEPLETSQPASIDLQGHERTLALLWERFGRDLFQLSRFRDNLRVIVPSDRVFEVLRFLKEEARFDMLMDVTAVDYLYYPGSTKRFGVIWSLLSTATGERLFVKTYLDEPDLVLPSVYGLWRAADWLEREVYDMFGIRFTGHPNLKRILLPQEFVAYPLRKDYPLRGLGERHNFRRLSREES